MEITAARLDAHVQRERLRDGVRALGDDRYALRQIPGLPAECRILEQLEAGLRALHARSWVHFDPLAVPLVSPSSSRRDEEPLS